MGVTRDSDTLFKIENSMRKREEVLREDCTDESKVTAGFTFLDIWKMLSLFSGDWRECGE